MGSLRNAPEAILHELDLQLQIWREALPKALQWRDEEHDTISLTPFEDMAGPAFTPTSRYSYSEAEFTGATPLGVGYNFDIITAALRTRFYHARLLIHLPFVYKALHSPQDLSPNDVEGCRKALSSACNWPLATSPARYKKRLVPHLFAWTQNFTGILLILRMIRHSETLLSICQGEFDFSQIDRAATGLLEWIDDIRKIDGIAQWSWKIIQPLYATD